MKRFVKALFLACLFALLLFVVLGARAFAQDPDVLRGDKTVFGGTFLLESGERLEGDLAVFGGVAEIEEDAVVDGSVALLGGRAEIDGRVRGDVMIVGGQLELGGEAVIEGNLAAFGGNIDRAPGAEVLGDETRGGNFFFSLPPFPALPGVAPATPAVPPAPVEQTEGLLMTLLGFLFGVIRLAFTTAAMGLLGLVVTLFLPSYTTNTAATATKAPGGSTALGCLSIPAIAALAALLVVIIIGIPVALLVVIATLVAGLFGLVALGLSLGDRLLRLADVRSPRPAASAAIGTGLLWLVSSLVDYIPCIGNLFWLLVVAWGLGAVLLSRGGTQRYPLTPRAPRVNYEEPLIQPLDEAEFERELGPSRRPPAGDRGAEGLLADLESPNAPSERPDDDERL